MVGNIVFDQWLRLSSVTENPRFRTIANHPARELGRLENHHRGLDLAFTASYTVNLQRASHAVLAVDRVKNLHPSAAGLL
jgi:hypothetical protein